MGFKEAFKKLGYELKTWRTDWSAEHNTGVCLSLWKKETDYKRLLMDTREHAGELEVWRKKAGNAKRIRHAAKAIEQFGGWVDVVTIDGNPGEGYENAHPWIVAERHSKRWRVTYLDKSTGHLRLEAQDWVSPPLPA